MNSNMRRTTLIVVVLLAFALVLAACQRERPAGENQGWTVTPAAPTSGTPAGTGQPPLSTTTVSVGTLHPGAPSTPGSVVVTATLPAAVTPVVVVTPVTAPVVVPAGPTFGYVVKAGDTLFSIALTYGTDVETLRRLNNLPDDTIQIGQVLVVPGTGQAAEATPLPGAAPVAVPPTAVVSQVTYTVQAGDNLSGIAAQFGITWQELAAANNIQAPNYTIYRGQKLVIPGVSATPVPAAPQKTHVVAAGETLYSIAVQYGTTVQAIMAANQMTNPDLIRVGQEIVIP